MKIEVGKFYRHKETGEKLLACLHQSNGMTGYRTLYFNYKSEKIETFYDDEIEEWREPKTKDIWVYLTDNDVVLTSDEDVYKLKAEGIQFIGAKKVTLVEGVWK